MQFNGDREIKSYLLLMDGTIRGMDGCGKQEILVRIKISSDIGAVFLALTQSRMTFIGLDWSNEASSKGSQV